MGNWQAKNQYRQGSRMMKKILKLTMLAIIIVVSLLGWGLFWFTYIFERVAERKYSNWKHH
jgi:hypothetical protein